MTFEDYKREVLEDALARIEEENFEDWDDCWDDLWLTVTGNDDGSYFGNRAKAVMACAGVEFDENFLKALEWHLGCDPLCDALKDGPESFDVLVRIVALYEVSDELEERFQERGEGVC